MFAFFYDGNIDNNLKCIFLPANSFGTTTSYASLQS